MKMLKKVFRLLNHFEKKQSFILLLLILVMSLLDMVGVASIFPFIQVLINPKLVETNIILAYFYNLFNISEIRQFQFIFGLLVFFVLIASIIVRALTYYVQIHFSLMREYSISKRLVEGYLNQSYAWFLSRHSANLGKNILSEVNNVVIHAIIPITTLFAQSAVAITLLILIFMTDPILAINVGLVLFISYGMIFYFSKNFLSNIGFQSLQANEDRFRTLTEVFNAIKEVKFGGLEKTYIKYFDKPSKIYASNQSKALLISNLPRYFIEGIIFGGMIILLIILIKSKDDFINIVPVIAIYAFVGYRLIPALQQIYYSISQINFAEAALNSLHKDLIGLNYSYQKISKTPRMKLSKCIKLDNIYFSYPNHRNVILKNISFSIKAFSKVGIVGPTGSGKSTMIDIILGLIDPSEGSLKIDENIISNKNKRSWQQIIGYVPQQIYLSDDTIAANIAFGINKNNIDYKAVKRSSKIANLHDFIVKELPEGYNTIIGERGVRLSGGQRQRIGIARSLYRNPQVLIFDEATSALDDSTEHAIMEAINNLGNKITVILIAHRSSMIKNCDYLFLFDQGKLKAEGTYNELIKSNKFFKKS